MIVKFEGKVVGRIELDTYFTNRKRKIHFLRIGQGYPISKEVLAYLKSKEIKKIIIIEDIKYTNKYLTTLDKYLNAPEFEVGGFEKQRCLPLREMTLL